MFDFSEAETIIGYRFKNIDLLKTAFTHSSYVNEHKNGVKKIENNERLEFLGDSMLGIIVAKRLYDSYPQMSAGEMTREKQRMVSTLPLSDAMRNAGLGQYLLCGESMDNNNLPASVLENLCECLIAAIYLDGGVEPAVKFADKFILSNREEEKKKVKDYKSELQVYSQSIKAGVPRYALVSKEGPDHSPIFTVSVEVCGVKTEGSGRNKAMASQEAANKALKIITGRNK